MIRGVLLLAFAMLPYGALANEAPDTKTAAYVAKQKEMLTGAVSGTGCHTVAGPDEIVVCGRGIDQRIRTIAPPDFSGPRQVKLIAPPNGSVGVGVSVSTGCLLQKCPYAVKLIDLAAIPKAPAGSEADLIARGLLRDR